MFDWLICKIKGHDVELWWGQYFCRRCEKELKYERI